MGEEKKEENGAAAENKVDEKQSEAEAKPEPVVLKVDMHCAGCARGVRKAIKSFKGVEQLEVDMQLNKVTVKGNVDPLKLRETVQRKSGRKTELVSPLVLPNKTEEKEKEKIKTEEKKDKPEPVVVTVVLNVSMHCEGCAQTVKKNILKLKGVQTVDPDFKSQKVTVKGTVDPKKLAEHLYRRTGKRVQIQSIATEVKAQDSDGKPEVASENKDEVKPAEGEKKDDKDGGEEKKEEAKADDGKGEKKDGDQNNEAEVKKDGEDKKESEPPAAVKEEAGKIDATEAVMLEGKKYEVSYPRYVIEHVHPPQLFSDENPNACSIM